MYIPIQIVEKFGNDIVGTSGNDYIYHCPMCEQRVGTPDKNGNLWVNGKELMFHCFRCEWSGYLNHRSTKGYTLERNPSSDELAEQIKKSLGLVTLESTVERFNYKVPQLPALSIKLATDYLHSRGLNDYQIRYYDMRFSSYLDGKYKNRIIIPNKIINKGTSQYTDMFVARKLLESDTLPKYLNPVGNNKSHVVFNLHRIPSNYPIIITEGVFSCISAGYNAVATYGKAVSDQQIDMILQKNPSKIYVSLDPDAIEFAKELCERILHRKNLPVYLVKLPMGEDPNSLGTIMYNKYLGKASIYNPLMISIEEFLNKSDL